MEERNEGRSGERTGRFRGDRKWTLAKNKGTSVKEKKDEGHLELVSNNCVVDNETVMMMKGSYRVR